ncbi:hypothetical protein RIF29_41437 [Crotalaria pallida]|uniref:Uncharacterized protein n=1 Tax=Crotalaria pallida TaxID=3830 RepID=A0AAN9E516_CROPI
MPYFLSVSLLNLREFSFLLLLFFLSEFRPFSHLTQIKSNLLIPYLHLRISISHPPNLTFLFFCPPPPSSSSDSC